MNTGTIVIGRVGRVEDSTHVGVYIGRPKKGTLSPLGNPFPINALNGRDAVCDKYHAWLLRQYSSQSGPAYTELRRLTHMHANGQNMTLQCFCAPQRCHGESIKKAIRHMKTKGDY